MKFTTTYPAIVGAVLKARRVARDVPQRTFAKQVGLSTSVWSRIESGSSACSIELLVRVAKEFNTTPGELLRRADYVQEVLQRECGVLVSPVRLKTLPPGHVEADVADLFASCGLDIW